ncbi:MAG: PqqD family protein [Solirubrobacteraceae bacterium]
MPSVSLVVDTSHVVHETIDGEAILIHLGTGTYYSLDGAGAEVWGLLAAGVDVDSLLAAARERYDGDPVELKRGLSSLLEELSREGLLIEGEPRPAAGPPGLPSGRVPFVVPVLRTYTDMQEFMLVDPLREVDAVAGASHAETG